MKVLVAPDSFKGSLTADAVAVSIATGLEQHDGIVCARLPLADGGEGSVAAALAAGFRPHPVDVVGPTGRRHRTTIAVDDEQTAVVEVANTCGITLLPGGRPEPLAAGSLGFGQAVRAALDLGVRTVVLALGGSASTDGGLGLLSGLGASITDAAGRPVRPCGGDLHQVERVELSTVHPAVRDVRWVVASDVDAIMTGAAGAAQMFGPQKGASAEQVEELDHGLARLARVCGPAGLDAAGTPGAGAAGGLGFAALLLDAEVRSGAEFFLDLLDFDTLVADADVVVTGEGSLDEQTVRGKLPYVVARRGAPRPAYAIVGRSDVPAGSVLHRVFRGIRPLSDVTDADTRHDPGATASALTAIGRELGASLLLGP